MLELKNVTYEINEQGNKRKVLDNVSCSFLSGEFVAVTGHNGSGKSTLTKVIMGITAPTSGEIWFNGVNITNLSITERANLGINYAFQQPVTFVGLTVKDLIDIATKKQNSIPEACKYLSRVGLCAKEYVNRTFDKTLSGGEQKRIELALALAKKGECLIFDEPEAGIDMWSFEKLNQLFSEKQTRIIVSHQENLIKNADKILVLKNGKIEMFDHAQKVLKQLPSSVCGVIKSSEVKHG